MKLKNGRSMCMLGRSILSRIKEENVPEDIIYNTEGQHTYSPLQAISLLGSNRTLTTPSPPPLLLPTG